MEGWIAWIITEHKDHLTPERKDVYGRSRGYFAAICGCHAVKTVHYTEALKDGVFAGCCAVILSGSSALWETHDAEVLKKFGNVMSGLDLPLFGICAGLQLIAMWNGGAVGVMRDQMHGHIEERGYQKIQILKSDSIFEGLDGEVTVKQVQQISLTAFRSSLQFL